MPRMPTLDFRCPYCQTTTRTEIVSGETLQCPSCQQTLTTSVPPLDQKLKACLVCSSPELFVRKSFPQRMGVGIVVIGFVGSSIAWFYHHIFWSYGILFATALIDIVLYLIMGNLLQCYRCHAQYRGLTLLDAHSGFDLETHERYRQEAARLNGPRTGSNPG